MNREYLTPGRDGLRRLPQLSNAFLQLGGLRLHKFIVLLRCGVKRQLGIKTKPQPERGAYSDTECCTTQADILYPRVGDNQLVSYVLYLGILYFFLYIVNYE